MAGKKKIDAVSEAALSTVEMQIKREQIKDAEQKKRELLISQCHEVIGRIQATNMMSKFGDIAGLVWLKQVKELKLYRDLPNVGTWETFCNYTGKSRRMVDEQLQNLDKFGEEFLATLRQFSLSYKDLRKLRKSVSDGDMIIEGEFVIIGEEKIHLSPDSKDDLEAAFEVLVEERDRKLEESQTRLKVKDRMLVEKERVIQKQENDLSKFTKEIEARDYKPGEKEFIKQMENKQLTITGMFLELDPEKLPEDATPIMIAKYIEVLSYFKRAAHAYLDTALENHAQPDDIAWQQPDLKKVGADT